MRDSVKEKRLFAGSLFVFMAALSACRPASTGKILETPFPVVDSLGNSREYRLFLPARGRPPYPLLVYFHGVISPGFKNIRSLKKYTGSPIEETGLIPFCGSHGIALLVPKAKYEYTFLKCPSVGWVVEKELDGVEKIIDTVLERFSLKRREVYLAGISAGAVFCHFLANHRPFFYNAIVSHSQAYISAKGEVLKPAEKGPQFGIVFAYNIGDYKQLIGFCKDSERVYREAGYRTKLLPDLPPRGHAWSAPNNALFWKYLHRLGRQS